MVVPTGTALPLALPANELVANALKHAFPGTTTGRVAVRFAPTEEGWLLQVADDGIGLPDGFERASRRSLGMRLVKTLAGQLGAVLEIEHTAGTVFTLRAAMPPA
ncbi:sensor histidine kinase [Azospirillum lipoferum]|uniref:sensor histidine kinase n=1 Tax=Azospirillum lipoferum TaxID=193 RepID=UPI0002E95E06|nr:sensor histidine kinase [Azospirillum lipoferum]